MVEPSYITSEMSDDFEQAIRLGAEAGIHTVGLRSKAWGQNLEDMSDQDIHRMTDVLSNYGVRVGAILSPVGKCDIEDSVEVEEHMKIFQRTVELADIFDTHLVRTFPFRRSGYQEYEPSHLDEYVDLIVERLMPAVKLAESEGVVMCFECVGSTLAQTSQEIRRVIDALDNSPAVGVVWEIDVACKAGELPAEGYPFVKGLVRDVHIKPNPDYLIDLVGTSTATYENAFQLLLADGYEGPATIEHWGTQERTLSGIRQLQTLLDKVYSAG